MRSWFEALIETNAMVKSFVIWMLSFEIVDFFRSDASIKCIHVYWCGHFTSSCVCRLTCATDVWAYFIINSFYTSQHGKGALPNLLNYAYSCCSKVRFLCLFTDLNWHIMLISRHFTDYVVCVFDFPCSVVRISD